MINEDVNKRITIILKENKGNLLANAHISINTAEFGFVTIKGFQIWRSKNFNERLQEAINIQPPTKSSYGRPYKFVFFEDKKLWCELELIIYEEYIKARSKNEVRSEEVNLDDIPETL